MIKFVSILDEKPIIKYFITHTDTHIHPHTYLATYVPKATNIPTGEKVETVPLMSATRKDILINSIS